MKVQALLLIYRLLWRALGWIAVPLLLWWRSRRGKEEQARRQERLGYPSINPSTRPVLWLHAASVGESLAALGLVLKLQLNQTYLVLITTTTVTGASVVAQHNLPHVVHQYVPLDHPDYVQRFLRHWQPRALWLIESELWVNLVTLAAEAGIPVYLIDGKLSARSFKRWQAVGPEVTAWLLANIKMVLVADETQRQLFSTLGALKVQMIMPLKFLRPPLPVANAQLEQWQQQLQQRPCWLAASTHRGEEEVVIAVHQQLQTRFPDLVTIIAPRHPQRVTEVIALLTKHGYQYELYSQSLQFKASFVIVDTIGQLGTFFKLCPAALIGGSLFSQYKGHNIIEPAQLGCVPLYGPYYQGWEAVCHYFQAAQAGFVVNNAEAIVAQLERLMTDAHDYQHARERVAQALMRSDRYNLAPLLNLVTDFAKH